MKQRINLGAYGWCHKHWLGSFYPEDLPVEEGDDWRLRYYSNEFNTVLVPAIYWQTGRYNDCEDWLESVHADFRFFVECHSDMLNSVSLTDLTAAFTVLAPQLSGLVLSGGDRQPFIKLAEALEVELISDLTTYDEVLKIWQAPKLCESRVVKQAVSGFAFIEDELFDLRRARVTIEQYAAQINHAESSADAVIIVKHPQLQASQLTRLCSVLDIMGY